MKQYYAASLAVLVGLVVAGSPSAPATVPVPALSSADGPVHRAQAKPPQKSEKANTNAAAERQRQAEQAKRNAIEKVKQAAQKAKDEAARKARDEAARKSKEKEEAARKVREKEEAARKNREKEEAARKAKDAKLKEDAARIAKEAKAKEDAARIAKDAKTKEDAARLANERNEAMRRCIAAGRRWSSDGRCEAATEEGNKPGSNISAECLRSASRSAKGSSGASDPCGPGTSTPQACPSGQQRDPKNPSGPCIAIPSTPQACPSGQHRDPKNPSGPCIATPARPPACPQGQYRDPQNPAGPCIASPVECAQGTARRRAGGDCQPLPGTSPCPTGQRRDYGGYCVCTSTGRLPERNGRCEAITEVPRPCPDGTYRDPRNPAGACIPYARECPPGMTRRSLNSPCEWIQRADPPRPERHCPQGAYLNRFGECEFPREEPPRTAQPERPGFVPLPMPLPTPSATPPSLAPRGPELAGLCKGKPGSGPEDDVVLIRRKEIDTTRGAHEITYGSRQRKLVPIKDLPGAVGTREWDGQVLHADAYADLAAKPSTCKGRTDGGYELRIVDVPMLNGGTAPACIVYCRTGDTPSGPPVMSEPGRPAIGTVAATPVIQPYRPAVETVYARPQTEPRRLAVPTVVATPAPERRRPAVPTLAATPSLQPKRLAVQTVKASPAIVPARRAVETVKARSIEVPTPKR